MVWKIIIPLFFLFVSVDAQNINFRQISVEQGLSHTDVTSIVQDSCGFIYMGTNSGLSRYDGTEIVTSWITEHGMNNVYFNRIVSLALSKSNVLWVGTQGGIIQFDLQKQKFKVIDFRSISDNKLKVVSTYIRIVQNNKL